MNIRDHHVSTSGSELEIVLVSASGAGDALSFNSEKLVVKMICAFMSVGI